jgi:hypothetical protein
MKVWVVLSSLAVVCALVAAPGLAKADTGDGLCPQALPKVDGFTTAGRSNDPGKIAEAAKAAADAFRLCMSDARITGPIEPRYNYDELRAAYFTVVEGRALEVLGKPAEAIVAFKDARSLANELAAWEPDSNLWSGNNITGTASSRNSDRRPSQYKDAAVQIRTVAESELAKLGQSTVGTPAPVARPQAVATPAPH